MHGAALSYNYQLAEKIEHEGLRELHEENFQEWRNALPLAEIARWNINELWALTHREAPSDSSADTPFYRILGAVSSHDARRASDGRCQRADSVS